MSRLLRRTFRIQYASNLFTHTADGAAATAIKPAVAPYLALLGNTVSTETREARFKSYEFLSYCANTWKQTLLVPAYTELGCSVGVSPIPWTERLEEVRGLLKDVNAGASVGKVVLMDLTTLPFPEGVNVLGFSGWSAWSRLAASPKSSAMPTLYAYSEVNPATPQPMTVSQAQDLAREDMEWLDAELRIANRTPTVLLSHGLSSASLVKQGLPAAAYELSDLMSFYPFPFLFSRERCVKACLGGAIGGTVSGTVGGRFHAVNAWKSYPAQSAASPDYRPDAFFEYSWMDEAQGEVRELLEAYARTMPMPMPMPMPMAWPPAPAPLPKFEAAMA